MRACGQASKAQYPPRAGTVYPDIQEDKYMYQEICLDELQCKKVEAGTGCKEEIKKHHLGT